MEPHDAAISSEIRKELGQIKANIVELREQVNATLIENKTLWKIVDKFIEKCKKKKNQKINRKKRTPKT